MPKTTKKELQETTPYQKNYDVIVIGGGASGLMASVVAAQRGAKVLLVEKNKRLGEKLRVTGGGRCNILNAEENEKILLKKYGKAEQFLYTPFSMFGVKEAVSFFNERGMKLVVEHAKRAFPSTYRAEDVALLFERELRKYAVEVLCSTTIDSVHSENGEIRYVASKGKKYYAHNYIIATGSLSHKETGSTGDGYLWLNKLGHTVKKPTPSIVPLVVKESWVKDISGTSLDNAKITFFVDNIKSFSVSGRILFTHFGLSGPLILNNATKVADLLYVGNVTAEIDMDPKKDFSVLEQEILIFFDKHKNKTFKNIIKDITPPGMHKGIIEVLEQYIDVSKKVHSITKEERKKIIHIIKALPLTIEGLAGFDKAVIADGGLLLTEIDMKTMRSRKINNLLVTGDIIDINRPSGGYSLMLCWTTGYIAGCSVSS